MGTRCLFLWEEAAVGEGAGSGEADVGAEDGMPDGGPGRGGGGPVGVGVGRRIGGWGLELDGVSTPELTTISMARFEARPAPSTAAKRMYRGAVVGEVARF